MTNENTTRDFPRVRARLTRETIAIDLLGLVETMNAEDRLAFCRAVAMEESIFTGLCEAIAHEHGWLWQDAPEMWSWGKHTADDMREALMPLMPEAAVHLLKNAKDEAARTRDELERARRDLYVIRDYARKVHKWLVEAVGPKNVEAMPLPERPKALDMDAVMKRSRKHREEAREEIAKTTGGDDER